jgi:hypothetical protein
MIYSNNISFTIEACGEDRELYEVVYWYDKGNFRTWNPYTWDEPQSYDEVEILFVYDLDNGQDCYTMMTEDEIDRLEVMLLERNTGDI